MRLRSTEKVDDGSQKSEAKNGVLSNDKSHSNGIATNGALQSNGKAMMNGKAVTNGYAHHDDVDVPEKGIAGRLIHFTFVPIALMIFVPNLAILFWYSAVKCDSSYLTMLTKLSAGSGFLVNLTNLWLEMLYGLSADVWIVLLGYSIVALILMVIIPGEKTEGILTPKGNMPVYKDNGTRCYLVTLVLFAILTYALKQQGLSPTIVYDKFDKFLLATNIGGHVLCTFLLIKGLTRPSTSDSGSSGNLLFDYYWGTELYPRVFGIDIKVFTNCRFGMTVWPLLVLIFAIKSYELHGFVDSMWVSCFLQMVYITKFFWWEAGYYRSIDIIVDRAGYMICWGCLSFIPGIYTSCSLYLVTNPVHLGPVWSSVILLCGTMSILVNYWSDYQRQVVRSTDGQCTIWGKRPELIRAKYWLQGENGPHIKGEEKNSILLVSGFWSIARHFNYVPEIMLSFFWSVPGLFNHLMLYSYVIYLTILLTHRSFRDDEKCLKKYGKYWQEYCRRVPYKMVPGII